MPDLARRRGRALALVLAVAAAATLSACTSAPAAHPTPVASTAAPIAIGATDVPTAVPNKPALRKDVTLTSCQAAKGGWQAGGTIVNHSSKARKYRIEVFFTAPTTTVLGSGSASVHVDAGASKTWTIDNDRFTPTKPTVCVVSGVS
jgi:hypothetical protein